MIADRLYEIVSAAADRADNDALGMARICLLDWLACALVGAREPVIDALIADAEPVEAAHCLPLIGRTERVGLRDMVLINGVAGHAVDYDDGHKVMTGHPGVSMLPALLGLAVRHGIGGDQFLRGIVAAYEAGARIGCMMGPDHYGKGFHATGTMGAVGAAVGGAWMIGLPAREAATALGLAGTRAAGLKASFGTDGKPLHAGWASLVAFTSVEWARHGMTGASAILEHNQGLGAAASTSFDAVRGLAALDRPHIHTTMFKQHAACGVTHPGIRAAQALRGQVGEGEILHVRIRIGARAGDICNQPDPQTGLALKFSLRGVLAMTLLGIDTANPAMFSGETCRDPALRNLIGRSDVRLDTDLPLGPTWIEIDLADGRTLAAVDHGTQTRDLCASRAGVIAKFDSIAVATLPPNVRTRLRDEVISGSLNDIVATLGECAVGAPADTASSLAEVA